MKTDEKNDEAVMYFYKVKGVKNSPVIITLPILGGAYFFSEYFSKALVNNGYNVLRFERKKSFLNGDKGLEYVKEVLKQTALDVMTGIDWLRSEDVDLDNIGITGISMGGIVASLIHGIDRRIKAGVYFLSGGDLAKILKTSRESDVIRFRDEVMKNEGLLLEEFYEKAKDITRPVDPLIYANRVDPASVLMINALLDKVILPENSNLLWQQLRKPSWVGVFSGHYSAVLYLWYAKYRMVKHFDNLLLHPK